MEFNSQAMMLIFQMLDELAHKLGYPNGAQDLISEEPCVNVELQQIVFETLKEHLKLRLQNEEEISVAYI